MTKVLALCQTCISFERAKPKSKILEVQMAKQIARFRAETQGKRVTRIHERDAWERAYAWAQGAPVGEGVWVAVAKLVNGVTVEREVSCCDMAREQIRC